MRNNSQGCTMVFNSELRRLLLNLNGKNLILHDWAALMLAQVHGQVIFNEKPYVNYRLHQNNFIGHQTKFKRIYNYLKSLTLPKSKSLVFIQALEIMKTIPNPDQCDSLVRWCNSVNSSFTPRFKYLFANKNVYFREVSTFACALQIIMGKFSR